MKVLMINGSPHTNGATMRALEEMKNIFVSNNIDVEIITVGNKDIRNKKLNINDIIFISCNGFEEENVKYLSGEDIYNNK